DAGFERELEAFTQLTGIELELGSSEEQDVQNIATGDLELPDIVAYGGRIPTWAQPRAIDIDQLIDSETLRADFGEYLLRFGTVADDGDTPSRDGTVRAIPLTVDLKGLVYYPKEEFEAAGYEVPANWEDLLALSHQIVTDGGTPWCFGFASGFASGWPGSDFLESLVLRVDGVDTYDAWIAGDVGFTSPAVMEAGRLADELIFEPGFVRGGPELISNETWDDQLFHMLNRNSVTGAIEPECWLYHQANFVLRLVPPGTRIGQDIDFFVLPPVDPDQPTPSIGGGLSASALVDRPEVRAFVEFMASPQWGEVWAGDADGGFISANRRFDTTSYGDPAADPAAAVRFAMASAVRTALDAGVWRYDASDLMPTEIGGWTEGIGPGAFWQGLVDWVDGIRPIEEVLADIDAERAALGTDGEP
ncbi:MAG TPA: ABC transporter substrate-binding protein, partial [Ilumatobacteraceae bacterium]|nr:ABC transporter substrate-binding protein [Ilumatobacteraceae bacterium]